MVGKGRQCLASIVKTGPNRVEFRHSVQFHSLITIYHKQLEMLQNLCLNRYRDATDPVNDVAQKNLAVSQSRTH